jgi:hypothetical protein
MIYKLAFQRCNKDIVYFYTDEDLHLFSFTKAGTSVPDEPCETPTLWAVMSGESVAYCASSMRNGVKRHVFNLQRSGIGNDLKQSTPAGCGFKSSMVYISKIQYNNYFVFIFNNVK